MRSMRLLLLLRSPRSLRCTIPCMAPTASGTQEGVLHRQHHTAKHVLTALQLFFAASLHRLNHRDDLAAAQSTHCQTSVPSLVHANAPIFLSQRNHTFFFRSARVVHH
jgi:hypothetical protein